MSPEAYNKRIQDVNDQFAEARLLIEVCFRPFGRCGAGRLHPSCELACLRPHRDKTVSQPACWRSPRAHHPALKPARRSNACVARHARRVRHLGIRRVPTLHGVGKRDGDGSTTYSFHGRSLCCANSCVPTCPQDALDSNGTTYFEEDLADAQVAVAECLKLYTDTIAGLDDKRKGETQRSMGMKMEQLKVRSCPPPGVSSRSLTALWLCRPG